MDSSEYQKEQRRRDRNDLIVTGLTILALFFAAYILFGVGTAHAQAVQTAECTKGCTLVTDPFPAGETATVSCLLVGNGSPISRPVIDGTAAVPPLPAGKICHFKDIVFLPGAYKLTAIKVGADGRQSDPSLPLTLTAIAPPPGTPTGLRIHGQ